MSDLKIPLSSQSSDEEYALLEGIRADDQRVEEYEEKRDAEDDDYQPLTQESIGSSLFSSQGSESSDTAYQPSSTQESDSTTSDPFSCSQELASSQGSDSTTSDYFPSSQASASSLDSDSTTSNFFSSSQGFSQSHAAPAHSSADEETVVDDHAANLGGPSTPTTSHGQSSHPGEASSSSQDSWKEKGLEYDPWNDLLSSP
ncbi:hypothetical protein EYR40_003929 [Pleurotus pulmonarius]|nr:hypothetical protein EYR36_007495 [Pleurotus pulmonarius]KAF4605146.1 hypothetical protein EYR40_003929 [Pleurotus pulmonarius]KAF4606636.1 hypothetical protein EYR38_000690 [Pleurotus pulmonarius]